MNVGPYMAYICIYRYFFLSFIQKKGCFGGPKNLITSFWHFLAILAIKMAEFLKARTLFKTIFVN